MATSQLRPARPPREESPPISESAAASLTPEERAHATSILDATPTLEPIPPARISKILIGSVIRKQPAVVAALLKTLSWQRLRQAADIHYSFITDFPLDDPAGPAVRDQLSQFVTSQQHVTIRHVGNPGDDYGDDGRTRRWTATAWHRVGQLKNQLIQQCLSEQFDYLWLVDADVLCDPYTLQSLLDTQMPIVAGVYWTHWQRPTPGLTLTIHAGPQVWLRHPYDLSGHGYTEAEFRGILVARELSRVWGLGACTLFQRATLEKGVNFSPVPEGLPPGPMADGEDRHLCERARRLHIPLFADAWPDIWHAYHAADYGDIDKWLTRFDSPRPVTPSAPDLVSFKIESLEPVPSPFHAQLWQHMAPQFVRGRLAQLNVLPEIAEALGHMSVGERRIVSVHFPAHYAYPTLRLQTRLLALTLLDCKPFTYAPTIAHELFAGTASWKHIDATTLTSPQIDSMLEEAHELAAV